MKILIEVMHGLGDEVCALPMIENICLAYPDADITVLVNSEGGKEIIEHGNFKASKTIILNVHKDKKFKVVRECRDMRRNKYDMGISCALTSMTKAHLFMGAIAPEIKAGIQFSRKQDFQALNDRMHFVDANLEILKDLNISLTVTSPRLIANPLLVTYFRSVMDTGNQKKRIGVCIGNADATYKYKYIRKKPVYAKGWGISNMTLLCERLLDNEYSLFLIGGKQEIPLFKQMPEKIKSRSVSFVGKTTVAESMAVASLCDVLVGVDTGMQHIADALGVKTVSIFGPTNPHTRGAYSKNARFVECEKECKYCFGTARYTRCEDRKCLKEITVEHVFKIITEILKGEAKAKDGIEETDHE
ncbi:MAG: glycosyltransferase family 9 protein [Blautia sp.]|nr:glycosyltransferase family 9 protein [Blautia sp.]